MIKVDHVNNLKLNIKILAWLIFIGYCAGTFIGFKIEAYKHNFNFDLFAASLFFYLPIDSNLTVWLANHLPESIHATLINFNLHLIADYQFEHQLIFIIYPLVTIIIFTFAFLTASRNRSATNIKT
ncbi:hypothetical protein CAP31_02625 [Sulfuriferula sp. AH1]|uniref:hypothetical protein n=1 Tax=Sulfuriferula sp. AH1 TaxID=1985873 RepID=UPI000B3B814F|nr:hypothetical protein [Sulfuriferula sp. AH1]ARU30676.1 hypothetical protein CAP31_02625 [Sulfuriferula sp. AH1]